jgi:hypothetical protein
MKELEDIFNTKEFKSLPWIKRFIIRLKVAVFSVFEYGM